MGREYRLVVKVDARADTVEERDAVSEALGPEFHDAPTEWDEWDGPKDKAPLILCFEGETRLGGGCSEIEAHARIRSTLGGRGTRTMWWYLEGAPDDEFYDPEDEG